MTLKRLSVFSIIFFAPLLILRAEDGRIWGKASSNASIVIRNVQQVIVLQMNADADGAFSVSLPLGEYEFEISGSGNEPIRKRVRIQPGIAFFSVEQPVDNLSAIVLDDEFLRTTLSDDPQEFAAAFSGVAVAAPIAQGFPGSNFGQRGFSRPRIQGPRANLVKSQDVLVNGEPGRVPPKDQIREVWIDHDPFTAEFSTPGFGRSLVLTSAGTNSFHGAGTFNFRDESLNASYSTRFPYQSRYWHGVLTGPLIRDRLLFSTYAERHGQDRGQTHVVAITPSGVVDQRVDNGWADQAFSERLRYEISNRHTLYMNGRYRSLWSPNLGAGGFSLPERGSNRRERNWEVQTRESALLSPAIVHETRFQVRRDTTRWSPVQTGVSIDVVNAFSGGGSSAMSDTANTTYQLENLLARASSVWSLRAGVESRWISNHLFNANNTLGTFTFASLADYVAGRPFSFLQFRGAVRNDVRQNELAGFAQTDWSVRPRLSVSGGLRVETQTNLQDHSNVDPRVSFAYSLYPSWALRGGFGTFHERLTAYEVATLRQQNGVSQQTVISISNPSYPDPFLSGTRVEVNLPAFAATGVDNLVVPYLSYGALSLEKAFSSGLLLSVSADFIRRFHDVRSTLRFTDLRRTIDYSSSGNTFAKDLIFRFRSPDFRFSKFRMRAQGDYTLSGVRDDNVAGATWARSASEVRHSFWGGVTMHAPSRLSASVLVLANSGFPVNLSPSTERNSGDGLNYFNLDARVEKTFRKITFFIYGQNVLNSRNYQTYIGDRTTSFFGTRIGPSIPRQLEVGSRLQF